MTDKKNTPNQTLYRKYRPQKFADVVGQDHIVKTLTNALKSNRLGHAYLFTGPRGTGKTTVARLFAAAINCQKRPDFIPANKDVCAGFVSGKALDLIEIDAASHTGVDNIRDLRETIALTPNEAPFKVYIIDEVHMLSTGAFNALLKTLEEPPTHAVFILATTDVHKVPDTIISRCQRFDFMRMGLRTITDKIQMIAKAEKITIEEEAAELVAIAASGGMRDAESLLAQVFALEDQKITAKQVANILGTTTNQDVISLLTAFAQKDIHQAIAVINSVVEGGYSMSTYTKSLIMKLRALLFYTLTTDKSSVALLELTTSDRKSVETLAKLTCTNDVLIMIRECEKASLAVKSSIIPSMPLEVAAVIICDTNQSTSEGTVAQQTAKKSAPAQASQPTATSHQPPAQSRQTSVSQVSTKPDVQEIQSEPVNTKENHKAQGALTIENIREKWPQLVGNIQEENPSLSSILRNYAPIEIQGNDITLHVKYDLHKEKLMEVKNKLTLSTALATIFSESVHIKAIKVQEEITPTDVLNHAKDLLGGQVVES